MDGEDDMRKGSVASLILESLEGNQNEEKLSAEDLAWVDSCLIKDFETLDSNWDSFKDVLLEILDGQPESLGFSETGSDGFPRGTDVKMLSSVDESMTDMYPTSADDDNPVAIPIPINNKAQASFSSIPIENKDDIFSEAFEEGLTETFRGDPFLPTYNEERVVLAVDSETENSLSGYEIEPSAEDIFRVWDLNISAEEDDIVKQLDRALAERDYKRVAPSTSDDSAAWKNVGDVSLDDLSAAIADLSLNQSSS